MKPEIPLLEIESLGYNIERALSALIKCLNIELKRYNLNVQHSQFSALRVISLKDGLSQAELSKILGKNPAAISRSLDYLEEKGYISRMAENGWKNKIFLTEHGRKIIPVINDIANKVIEKVLNGITMGEKEEALKVLTKIYHNSLRIC